MKSFILDSYSAVGMITSELPLSAHVIMTSLAFSFVFMLLRVMESECVFCVCVCEGLLFFCRAFVRSAVSILYTSHCEEGRLDMAVSA